MSKVTRTITGNKAGMLQHLRAQRDQWAANRDNRSMSQSARSAYHNRVVGIEFAIGTLDDWDLVSEPRQLTAVEWAEKIEKEEAARRSARLTRADIVKWCRCGYEASDAHDLAEHIEAASRIDDGQHHGATTRPGGAQ
jgi:hypothetical protein